MNNTNMGNGQDEITKQLHICKLELEKSFEAREKHARRMNVINIIQLALLVTTLVVAIMRLLQQGY